MNDTVKQIIADKLKEAFESEGLTGKEAVKISGLHAVYFSGTKTTEGFKRVPKKAWAKLQKWTNSGLSFKDYNWDNPDVISASVTDVIRKDETETIVNDTGSEIKEGDAVFVEEGQIELQPKNEILEIDSSPIEEKTEAKEIIVEEHSPEIIANNLINAFSELEKTNGEFIEIIGPIGVYQLYYKADKKEIKIIMDLIRDVLIKRLNAIDDVIKLYS